MDFIERNVRLKTLKKLIKNKTKGTPKELAVEIGVSPRTLFRLINQLEIIEARNIAFDRNKNYYYFQ